MDNGITLLPNDLYPLDENVFRLYYTSRCTEQQTIDLYIEDEHGQVVQKHLVFRMTLQMTTMPQRISNCWKNKQNKRASGLFRMLAMSII
jgi:hypothetical protein